MDVLNACHLRWYLMTVLESLWRFLFHACTDDFLMSTGLLLLCQNCLQCVLSTRENSGVFLFSATPTTEFWLLHSNKHPLGRTSDLMIMVCWCFSATSPLQSGVCLDTQKENRFFSFSGYENSFNFCILSHFGTKWLYAATVTPLWAVGITVLKSITTTNQSGLLQFLWMYWWTSTKRLCRLLPLPRWIGCHATTFTTKPWFHRF